MAGEASSEAERRNEGSTKCVRNPEKRECAMQTRDEKCIAFLAFFAKQKATLKIKIQNSTFVLIIEFHLFYENIQKKYKYDVFLMENIIFVIYNYNCDISILFVNRYSFRSAFCILFCKFSKTYNTKTFFG